MINQKTISTHLTVLSKKAIETENKKKPTKYVFIDITPLQIDFKDVIEKVDIYDATMKSKIVVSLNGIVIARAWKTKNYYVIKGGKNV